MSVKNLTSEAEGFLYGIFAEASKALRNPAFPLTPEEKEIAGNLAFDFERAAGAARFGKQAELLKAIPELVNAVNDFTGPGLKEIAEDLRLVQKLMYRHASPQLKDDLGSYSNGIF